MGESGAEMQEAYGVSLTIPHIEKEDIKGGDLFLRLLTGRKKTVTDLKVVVVEKDGKERTLVKPPAEDKVLVYNPKLKKGKLDWKDKEQKDDRYIAESSWAACFDTLTFAKAKGQKLTKRMKALFSQEAIEVDGALILPAHPGVVEIRKEGGWQKVDLFQDRGIEGSLVLLPADFKVKDLPHFVYELRQKLDEKKALPFITDLFLRFEAASQIINYYHQVLEGLREESFDQGYQFPQEELNLARAVLKKLEQQTSSFSSLLPEKERDKIKEKVDQVKEEVAENFLRFRMTDLANRLSRLGVKEEKLKEIIAQTDQPDFDSLKGKRVPPQKSQAILNRYLSSIVHQVFSPTGDYFAYLDQLQTQLTPEKQLLDLLAGRALKLLSEYLPLPEELRKGSLWQRLIRLIKKTSYQEEIPPTVQQWLEKQQFSQRLEEKKENLKQALIPLERLTPQEQEQYQSLRISWQDFILNQTQVKLGAERYTDSFSYPPHPVTGLENFNQLFINWRHQQSSADEKLIEFLSKEQRSRCLLAMEEYQIINQILDLQRKGKGYQGWLSESWKGEKDTFLESIPQRIIIDEELNCTGREGLVLAILEKIGLNGQSYSLSCHYHGFLGFEDSLGFDRVIEPSSHKNCSYFLSHPKLFHWFSQLKDKEVLVEEMRAHGRLERVTVQKGRKNWLKAVLKNWSSGIYPELQTSKVRSLLLSLNPEDEGLVFNEAIKRKTLIGQVQGELKTLAMNPWHIHSFYYLTADNWDLDKLKPSNLTSFSSDKLNDLKTKTETVLSQLRTPLDETNERNMRYQLRLGGRDYLKKDKEGKLLDPLGNLASWDDDAFNRAAAKLEKLLRMIDSMLGRNRGREIRDGSALS